MQLLSLFLIGTVLADLLFSNQYNSTKEIQTLGISNYCSNLLWGNKLSLTLVAQGKEIPLLVICSAIIEDIDKIQTLLDNDNFEQSNCLVDYNAYSFQSQTQQVVLSHRQVSTQVSLSHNVYSIQNNQCFVMIYSPTNSSYMVTLENIEDNECTKKCKNQGICVNGYCQCFLGYFGDDCGIMAANIQQYSYFQGLQIFYLDLITLQSQNFLLSLNSELYFTVICYYSKPHLLIPKLSNSTLFINESEIQFCKQQTQGLHQTTQLQYYSQFAFITSTQKSVQILKEQESSEVGITVIVILTSLFGLLLTFIVIIYCCRRYSEKQQQKKKMQIENLMPVFQFVSVTDRLPQSREEQQCSICLEKFSPNSIVRMTYCEHVFHAKCLQSWIQKNKNCPLCRALLDTQNIQSKVKIESKTNIHQNNILQQLSVFQKNEGSLMSIDGSLSHSPVISTGVQLHKVSRFRI